MFLDLVHPEIALSFSPGLKQPRIHLFFLLISSKIENRKSFKLLKILTGFNYSQSKNMKYIFFLIKKTANTLKL